MNTNKHRMRYAALAAGIAVVAAATVTGASATGNAKGQGPQQRLIASSTLGHDRQVTLTAVRSTADPSAASVRLAVYTYSGGHWKLQDQTSVGERDGWFWYPLTGSSAVCQFSTASASPEPIKVSLLVTPSIGCPPDYQYHVVNSKIVTD